MPGFSIKFTKQAVAEYLSSFPKETQQYYQSNQVHTIIARYQNIFVYDLATTKNMLTFRHRSRSTKNATYF